MSDMKHDDDVMEITEEGLRDAAQLQAAWDAVEALTNLFGQIAAEVKARPRGVRDVVRLGWAPQLVRLRRELDKLLDALRDDDAGLSP